MPAAEQFYVEDGQQALAQAEQERVVDEDFQAIVETIEARTPSEILGELESAPRMKDPGRQDQGYRFD